MLAIILLSLIVSSAVALPIVSEPSSPEYGNYIEGDIMEPFEGAYAGLLSSSNRWPNGVVVYKFDSSLSSALRSTSLTAMKRVTEETKGCIKFRAATQSDGSKYVLLRGRSSGCSATIGYWSRETYIDLASDCSVNSLMHEFQHTLGVYHQQSRPDRDNYVTIQYANVQSGHEHNFDKRSSDKVSSYGLPYDYTSQMHYSAHAFSKNGKPTIVPKPGKFPEGAKLGRRDSMSPNDIALVRAMYKC